MRKVLLATTALVAVGGVSAASADVSISGGYEAAYVSTDVSGGTSVNSLSTENFDYSIAFSNTLIMECSLQVPSTPAKPVWKRLVLPFLVILVRLDSVRLESHVRLRDCS